MRFLSPGIFQEAFRLNASTPRQVRAVQVMWVIGAVVAIVWGTTLNDVPEHGAIAVTAIAAAPSQSAVVDAEPARP